MYRSEGELYHHGIKGQKWGVRRYQNADGSLTAEGIKKYGADNQKNRKKAAADLNAEAGKKVRSAYNTKFKSGLYAASFAGVSAYITGYALVNKVKDKRVWGAAAGSLAVAAGAAAVHSIAKKQQKTAVSELHESRVAYDKLYPNGGPNDDYDD